MITFDNLRLLHIELTTRCQASCPMCLRNIHGGVDNPLLQLDDWTIDEFKKIINKEILLKLEHLQFCGNYGDALACKDILEIVQYVKEVNPEIILSIHTNGSFYKEEWWKILAQYIPHKHSVTFGIDGLEDTHSLYRIGTNFNKIIKNAESFISKGGIANWQFIRFKHNEHQIEDCINLAKKIGFKYFITVNTERFYNNDFFDVYNKNGEIIYKLELQSKIVSHKKDETKKNEIILNCKAIELQGFYIDASKRMYPCSFYSSLNYPIENENIDKKDVIIEMINENKHIMKDFLNFDLKKHSIKELIDSKHMKDFFQRQNTNNKLLTCIEHCGNCKDNTNNTEIIKLN